MNIRLILPLVAFPLALLVAYKINPAAHIDVTSMSSTASTFAQIGATMLGFMLAAMAILATISDTVLVKAMKQQGHYCDLLKTLYVGCSIYLLMAAIGLLFLLWPDINVSTLNLLIAISVSALVSIGDLGHKFWLVLSNLHNN